MGMDQASYSSQQYDSRSCNIIGDGLTMRWKIGRGPILRQKMVAVLFLGVFDGQLQH